jgi:hypothetical protein
VFDLPELNDKIFSYLSMNDLVRWARVSKGWHHAVIPYIWNDLSTLTKSQYKRLARMVINDYQRDQCHTPKITGDHQSSLVKYCPLIRKLGLVSGHNFIFTPFLLDFILDDMVEGVLLSDAAAQSIFHRFMVHCTSLRELGFALRHYRFHEPVKAIADSAIQHLLHLSIHGTIRQCAFKYMMARFPVTLETLELGCQIHTDSEHQLTTEIDEAEQEPLPSLRRLALRRSGYFHETFLFSLEKMPVSRST